MKNYLSDYFAVLLICDEGFSYKLCWYVSEETFRGFIKFAIQSIFEK